MMEPSLVVHTLGNLDEHIQIVRAKIELAGRSSKEKAAVRTKLSFRILAAVASNLARGGLNAHGQRAMWAAQEPDEYLARTAWQRAIDGRRHPHSIAEVADRFLR